jgi:hypothetical protein
VGKEAYEFEIGDCVSVLYGVFTKGTGKVVYVVSLRKNVYPYDDMVDKAKEDLAFQLKVLPSEITIASLERVVWPDTCLGGPKHSRCGVVVDVPGHTIFFEVDGKLYEYHTGGEYYRSIETEQ